MRFIHTRQRGVTMVEMMVAVAIGLIVTAAIAAVFLQSRVNASQDENMARMQENARFALNLLRSELLHADFTADLADGGSGINMTSSPPPTPTTDCDDSAGNPWLYQLATPKNRFFYMNNVADAATAQGTYSCINGQFKPGTDVLAIQRLLASPIDPADLPAADNAVYVRSNMKRAQMFHNDGNTPPAITDARDWRYLARVYYVETGVNGESTLVRENLTSSATPSMAREELIDGIERFHIEFGVDTDNDGVANFYAPDPTATEVLQLVTARIFVLARSPREEREFQPADKAYQLGSESVPAFGDSFYRRVYTTTVMLRNLSYRAGLGER